MPELPEQAPFEALVVAAELEGPPGIANGGYLAGCLATRLGAAAVEVALRAPAPLATPLAFRGSSQQLELLHGEVVVARARPGKLDLAPPAPPSFDRARELAGSCRAFETHPFPRCFVCGPERGERDGLCIFPGWDAELGLALAPWRPQPWVDDGRGRVRPELMWAALDCPSAFPLLEDPEAQRLEPMVLGKLLARLDDACRIGERCVVVAWTLALEPPRGRAGTAIFGEDGRLCGVSSATWVSLAGRA